MHKDCDLVAMPMHRTYFILNLKTVILNKINYWNNNVIWKIFKVMSKFLVLPPCNEIVMNKILQFWLQVLNKLIALCGLVDQPQLLPLFTFLNYNDFLDGQIAKFSAPQFSHFPKTQSWACHFEWRSLGQTIASHNVVNLG
jgi:hypothetical protein